jgi:hypothetical protein
MRGIATLSLPFSLCVSLSPLTLFLSVSLSSLHLPFSACPLGLAGLVLYLSLFSRRGILERQWLMIASPWTEDEALVRDDACNNNRSSQQ